MIVIGHQDPGVQAQSVTLDRLLDQLLEVPPVRIVMKEVLSLVRSRGDMKPRAGLEYPQSSRHGWFLTFLRNCVNRSNPESRDVTPIPSCRPLATPHRNGQDLPTGFATGFF